MIVTGSPQRVNEPRSRKLTFPAFGPAKPPRSAPSLDRSRRKERGSELALPTSSLNCVLSASCYQGPRYLTKTAPLK
jgi:hypothetical protein